MSAEWQPFCSGLKLLKPYDHVNGLEQDCKHIGDSAVLH